MNAWLLAAMVLIVVALVPGLCLVVTGSPLSRLVGLALCGVITVVELSLLAQGFGRTAYFDVALVLAVLSVTGVLVYARFFGRTL